MRTIKVTERQLFETVDRMVNEDPRFAQISNDDEIINTLNSNVRWFDSFTPELEELMKKFNMGTDQLADSLKFTGDYLRKKYDLKSGVVYDGEKIVGFLIYSFTTKSKEGITDDSIEDREYPILLSTAVHPEYRQKGLLRSMIEKSKITTPFLVHTSYLSIPQVWEKLGCRLVQDLSATHGPGNKIEICK